jgi:6-pyruvoyl-tetrahydropterin synthase
VPSDQDYPSNIDGSPKSTYVNFLNTDKAGYNARANEVKEAIKGFDSTYDYRLYEYLYEANIDSLEFSENLDTKIINYLEKQRENNEESQTLGLNRAWESYLELLEAQSEARSNQSRMVPEGCIIAFTDGITSDYYVNGGTCYYGNK